MTQVVNSFDGIDEHEDDEEDETSFECSPCGIHPAHGKGIWDCYGCKADEEDENIMPELTERGSNYFDFLHEELYRQDTDRKARNKGIFEPPPGLQEKNWQVKTYVKSNKSQKQRKEEQVKIEHRKCATIKESGHKENGFIMMLGEIAKEESIQAVEEVWDWVEIEAAVDSACVDNVVNPKNFPGIDLIETEESKRGDSWTAAGGSPIKKLGEMKIPWQTETGGKHGLRAKAGSVSKTLISADRLLEAGYAVILNRRNPRIVHETTKEVIKLERRNRMFLMKMWVRVKVKKGESQPVFTRQGQK